MEKCDWIVAICNTGGEGVEVFKFQGNTQKMKEKILTLVEKDRYDDCGEPWDFGTEELNDIEERDDGNELYAYGCYQTYHIDYTAKKIDCIETI